MNTKKLLEELKTCIDLGHDYKIIDIHRGPPTTPSNPAGPMVGGSVIGQWKCRRCGYIKLDGLQGKKADIAIGYKDLKPGKD